LARRWQVRPAALLGVRAGRPLRGVDTSEAWAAAYAQVSGVLPVEDAPVLARTQVSVTTPGEVRLRVSAPAGGGVWVDDQPVESVGDMTLKLARGVHSVSVLAAAKRAIGLELLDVPGSGAAKVQFVTGR
jgi:hypothetical protein